MPHKPLQTYDRKMKRFVTASESKAVTAEGISNTTIMIAQITIIAHITKMPVRSWLG